MTKFAIAIALISTFVLTGCNTVKGVGKDVEAAGEGVQNAADKARR